MTTWEDNGIQFPRLIAEMEAAGYFDTSNPTTAGLMRDLCASMDLTPGDVADLIDRGQATWDRIVNQTPRPTDQPTTTDGNRRRLIEAESDRGSVYRRPRGDARVSVSVAAFGAQYATITDATLILTVHPDGSWTLEHRATGGYVPVPLTSGHIDQSPGPMVPLSLVAEVLARETACVDPGDVDPLLTVIRSEAGIPEPAPIPRYRFTRHTRPDGAGCRFSCCSVVAPEQRAHPGDRLCPAQCPDSDIEIDPTPADDDA